MINIKKILDSIIDVLERAHIVVVEYEEPEEEGSNN